MRRSSGCYHTLPPFLNLNGGNALKKLSAALLGLSVLSAVLSAATPASALGGCGANAHRNGNGVCVYGGQAQGWCEKQTGHVATKMPNGEMKCLK
jgi:hypothetical protein